MKRLALILALAACQPVPAIPERPQDSAFVSYGNSGSITGGGVITTIYPNNQLYRRYTSPQPGNGRTEWQQLSDTAFQDIKSVALAALADLPAKDTPQPCLDAGIDQIVVRDFDNVESVEKRCPNEAMSAALNKVVVEVGRQLSIAEDQGL